LQAVSSGVSRDRQTGLSGIARGASQLPDMKAVRATIKYAMATGRLEAEEEQRRLDQSQ
jgi:hypothetical protein